MTHRTGSTGGFADILTAHADARANAVALRFLADHGDAVTTLTYGQLACRAQAIAAAMREHMPAGERALLLFPSGADYVAAFFGCLYAGVIAVPAYPPESARPQALARIVSILHDAAPRMVLTTAALQPAIAAALQAAGSACHVMAVDAVDAARADAWRAPPATEPIAFLQYTSGSTAQPKGVMVTHDNLRANEAAIRHGFGIDADDTIVSWLPLYHDMGLIGGLLQPIYSGVPVVLMSPQRFLQRPLSWLEAISTYGGTVSGGPDFAYRLCAERIPDAAIAGLDLSRWRVAFSGSEPVRADTLRAFGERFAPAGFASGAVYPCYGLAEATLFVSGGTRGAGLRTLRLDKAALAAGHANPVDAADAADAVELTDCGTVAPAHALRIAHPETGEPCADGVLGEIWAAGDSIAAGYWRNAHATAAAFLERDGHRWLRTGDLGFVADGRLFIGGRQKDMIIVRGQNHYPQDVEAAVEREVEVVRKGRVAAFAVTLDGVEGIGVAAEVGRGVQKLVPAETLAAAVAQAVAQAHGEPARVVVLLQAGGMPKTSSGKLQRQACRRGWLDGSLDAYAVFENGRAAGVGADVTSDDSGAAAPSPVAATVAEIWADVLQMPEVHPADNFFAIGGSSLAAARILARIEEALGVRLSLGQFFDAPTLRNFAAATEQAGARLQPDAGVAESARTPAEAHVQVRSGDFPLSPAQRRLWFLAQLEPESPAYHIAGTLQVRGVPNRRALAQAFEQLVARHESLRTTFHDIDGVAVQRVHAALPPAIAFEDAEDADHAHDANMPGWIERQTSAPFDLAAGPLLRVAVRVHDHGAATLALTVHHLVADGWSINVLVGEFAALYRQACGAGAAILPPLALQYADHAVTASARHDQAGTDADRLAWWRTYLGDDHTPLALPADFPPPARPRHRAGTHAFAVPPTLHAALRRCAEREQATLFMVLLAGFQVLLHRYSGQPAVRVGVPVANRPTRQLESVVGFFVDTRVVHTVVDDDESFSALVQRIKASQRDAERHGGVAFEQLVEALQPERGHDQHPLFQAMLNLQPRNLAPLRTLPDLVVEAVAQPVSHAKLGLYLNVEEDAQAGTLGATLHYASERFGAASMRGLCDNLLALLQALAERPEQPVGSHALATAARRAAVSAWSQGPVIDTGAPWVHERIAAQARRTPDAVAVIDGDRRWRYGELDAQANALAVRLRAQGVRPDDRVAIVLGRGAPAVIAVLATLKAGAAYVPIDIEYPAARRRDMLDDAAVTCVLTDAHHAADIAASPAVPVLAVQAVDDTPAPAAVDALEAASLTADHLAYVIYTSGSTGRPKGAANTQGALRSRLAWMQAEYGIGADDAVLFKTPFSFDVSVWEILLPLMSGGRVVVAAPGEHRDPQRLCELMRAHDVTTVHFVPSMLQLWIEEPALRACGALRRVFSGGEALSPALRARVRRALPGVRFDNRYGPSEAAINATWWRCDGVDYDATDHASGAARVPIGMPIPNSAVRILDARLHPVPPGVPGHLYLGGEGVARGYLGRPGQTAERFVPDPLATQPGARLYRTGDLARWRHDGAIEYLGRIDDQVKLRGLRIELGEIEAQLQALPGVTAAAVRLCGEAGRERLAGYVAGDMSGDTSGDMPDGEALRRMLAQRLPDYMVPAVIVAMPSLPRLPSGKIDRRALPDIGADTQAEIHADRRRLPQAPEAVAIAAIWQQVLQVPQVGLDDDFFALGGHSLLAMQVVSRVRAALDVALPLRTLFDAPVLEAFVDGVRAAMATGQTSRAPALVPVPRNADLPLSHSQERMWFLWRSEPDGVAYNVGGAVRLTGALDASALQRALDALLLRHESLRTTFPAGGGVPVQRFAAAPDVRIAQVDLRGLPANERPAALDRLADAEANTPFDLERGPLLRMTLVAEADTRHVLLVTIHHIVSEGWAMDVFADEFATLYGAMVAGVTSEDATAALPTLPVQYADYAVWQRQWLASGERERQLDYWRARLGPTHPVLELPTDRPRRAVQSTRGNIHRFELDDALSAQIRQFGTAHGLTLFMTVSAALFALMYRYSGQPLLRLGFPVANRMRPELEGLIGAFLNTLVLQCEIDATTTVADLFGQVRQAAVDAQNHQDLPFHQLVDALQPRRSAAHTPLFQAMVNVQRWRFQQTREVAGLDLAFLPNDARATKFDLMLDVTDIDARLGCMFTYSTDLFDGETVARMATHWLQLLREMLAMPASRIAALPMLDGDGRAALRKSGAPLTLAAPAADTLHGLIAAQAARRPDAIALVFEDERLTYAELNTRANRLAHALIARGVGPEVRVGLAAQRSTELVVGLLAILKAGGAYVPLDPDYPAERLAYMIEDSGIGLLLTHGLPQDLPVPANVTVLPIAGHAEGPAHDPQVAVDPDHLAYIIYTSGSTGRPKGAQLTHRNVARLLAATQHWFDFGPDDVWTLFHSYAFDFSVWEIFGALCHGGKLVVVPYLTSRHPEAFLALIEREGVTVLNQTPSAFRQLQQVPALYERSTTPLRVVIFGGEALEPATLRPWLAHFGATGPALVNMYGITETTVHVTYRRIGAADLEGQRSPIGARIPDLGLYVLDGEGEPVPAGIAGELHVSGAGLARGYLGRAALTAERFVPDPFGVPGSRLYRTGDLARWNAAGELEYLGRIDHQVKIRGFRIELGEVEAQLLACEGVREAVVLAREDRLVSYVTGASGLDGQALRRAVGQALPDYMVPSAVMVLPALPLTANGKVDRRALPAPAYVAAQAYEAPQGATEAALAEIWQAVLGVARVGRHDNFFELGGDSLRSLQVLARAREQGWALAPRHLFEQQVLSELAALADSLPRGTAVTTIPALPAGARHHVAASYAQQRQWFLWQIEPEGNSYNMAGALRLRGRLDAGAVRATFDALAARHESLRTRFEAGEDGLARQIIDAPAPVAFEHVCCEEAQARDRAAAFARAPFDLANGPLLRVLLLELGADDHLLVVVMHHIVSDGWSMQVVLREFVERYRATTQGEPFEDKPLPIQYADYAVWQRQWLESGELERQLDYWKAQLGTHHPVLALPTDHPRTAQARYREAVHHFDLPAPLVTSLRTLTQQHGASLFMALLAGFQVLLHRYTGESQIRVGVPVANRQRVETEGVVGFFVNTQVLAGEIESQQTLRALLEAAKAAVLGAQANQDLPFEQLVEALQPERSLGQTPLFQVMHNHQRADGRALEELAGLTVTREALGEQGAKFEFTLDTEEGEDGTVRGWFSYAAELFTPQTIERMARHYLRVLEAVAGTPQQRVGEVALLDETERDGLLAAGRNPTSHPWQAPVHALFEAQAARRPDAVALVFEDERLTYAELNTRANRLAHALIARGVGPESRIGIAAQRSVEMVVGLLAILKAGGAYVPLDPDYPAERLAYMIEDSGIGLLLSHGLSQELPLPPGVAVLPIAAAVDGPEHDPQVPVEPEHLVYVIYTSGSTGRPKGVAIAQAAFAAHIHVSVDMFRLSEADRVLQFSTINFDGFVEQTFPTLAVGAALVLRGPALWDAATFREQVVRQRVTVADLTTAYWLLLAQHYAQHGADLGALRQVNAGGEAMPAEGVRAWREAGLSHIRLLNTYGPTEGTVTATALDCAPLLAGTRDAAQVSLGAPLAGRAIVVVDDDLMLVPAGVAGELCIGGTLLARGYLGRAALTAERFVPDPFGAPGSRLYRTGDLARWNAAGELEYLGRIDLQVKIRGFRIELGEVEAQLLACEGVREAAVLARDGRSVGYVSGVEGLDAPVLRHAVAQRLPDYMVPSVVMVLPALPLNPNGKVDRRALPAPVWGDTSAHVPPATPTEAALAQIWQAVLGVARVGRHDNFFELGGDSLRSLQVMARAREQGWALAPRHLFERQVLSELATLADSLPRTHATPTIAALPDAARQRVVGSHAQQRQWFLWQLAPQDNAYNMAGALRLRGTVDRLAVRQTFDALAARHESLRTRFEAGEDGLARQIIDAPAPVAFEHVRCEEALARDRAAAFARAPFDLANGPLLRVLLLELDADDHLLVVVMHHIVSDGWSMQVVLREFVERYRATTQGEPFEDKPLPIQYADYAVWQRQWLESGELERQLDYWKARLGTHHPVLALPTDHPRTAQARYREAVHHFDLPAPLVTSLRTLTQQHGASLFMALLAGFQVLLHRYTGESQIRVGVPVANRQRVETEGVVGFFVNTQVLAGEVDGQQTLTALLEAAKAAVLGAQANQDLPFEQLVEALQPERSLGQTPLFQVMHNHQRADGRALAELAGLTVTREPLGEQGAKFEFTLDTEEGEDGTVRGWFSYAAELFTPQTIERMARHYLRVLEAVADTPQQRVGAVALLDRVERDTVLQRGVSATAGDPSIVPLHALIADHAARRPDAIALVFEDERLSYAELNTRANRLAHVLIARGVGPEVRVGLAAQRSAELVVGLLAILKAGGAYVPLDPDYPAERLAYMIEDSGIGLLLTHGLPQDLPVPANVTVLPIAGHADGPAHDPQVAVDPDHLAYIIYTSGSTGRPKGAQLTHRNVARLLAATQHWFDFGPDDVWTLFHSYAFDFSVWEIFGALCHGGKLVVVPYLTSRHPEAFLALIEREGVTVLNQTPSAFRQLQQVPALYERSTTPLRVVIFGGEALEPATLRPWLAHFGAQGPALVNMYGITETTVHVTYRRIDAADLEGQRSPIGARIPDLGLYVLDGEGEPVPAGIAGELHVSGAGLARGYLGRAALTAERFVPDPFGAPGSRLYRTGDLARWNAAGELEYLGRIDHQVKIRGFRIELGEVEAQLLACEGVREAVVLAREDRLVSYVTGAAGLDSQALRRAVGQTLPDYMVPSAVMVLPALPLTANGKVDRRALPAPAYVAAQAYEAPQGATEAALAGIWQAVLGVARVGRHDNFFELGGHSMAALQVQLKIRQALFVNVPLASVFTTPVLRELASTVDVELRNANADADRLIGETTRLLDLLDEAR